MGDQLIAFLAEYLFLVVPLLALVSVVRADRTTRWAIVKFALVVLPLAFAADQLLEHYVYVPRPFVLARVSPLVPHAADSSFPSSHTLLTMAVAAVVGAFKRVEGIVLGVVSLCVGEARVLALLHSPLDIAGSALIALGIAYGAWALLKPRLIQRV